MTRGLQRVGHRLAAAFPGMSSWMARVRMVPQARALHFGGLAADMAAKPAQIPAQTLRFPSPDPTLGPGVNIYGYLRGQFGLGESARQYARALLQAGYPVDLADVRISIPHACGDDSLASLLEHGVSHGINVVFVNPDHYHEVRPQLAAGGYTIGFWFWELDTIPDEWMAAVDQVDEIWVASSFVEEAFRRATAKPVIRIPHPVRPSDAAMLPRGSFDLDEDAFVFLCSFDFNSSIHRKNPFAVIDAFAMAFPNPGARVQLLVKTSNGHRYPEQLDRLCRHASRVPRVLVRDQILTSDRVSAMQHAADAYVSLHRAEGLGMGMAESMAIGKPVIATAWSGNLDFMDDQNSCLVPCRLVPVLDGEYPHAQHAQWADASIEVAADWMRRLATSPALAEERGGRAREAIAKSMDPGAAATAMIARLRSLGNGTCRGPLRH